MSGNVRKPLIGFEEIKRSIASRWLIVILAFLIGGATGAGLSLKYMDRHTAEASVQLGRVDGKDIDDAETLWVRQRKFQKQYPEVTRIEFLQLGYDSRGFLLSVTASTNGEARDLLEKFIAELFEAQNKMIGADEPLPGKSRRPFIAETPGVTSEFTMARLVSAVLFFGSAAFVSMVFLLIGLELYRADRL